MTSNSKGILLLGATLLVVAFAGMSTVTGEGWVIPMATLLLGILLILIFSFMTISNEIRDGSNPISSPKGTSLENIETSTEDLPDPNDSGFDLPIL